MPLPAVPRDSASPQTLSLSTRMTDLHRCGYVLLVLPGYSSKGWILLYHRLTNSINDRGSESRVVWPKTTFTEWNDLRVLSAEDLRREIFFRSPSQRTFTVGFVRSSELTELLLSRELCELELGYNTTTRRIIEDLGEKHFRPFERNSDVSFMITSRCNDSRSSLTPALPRLDEGRWEVFFCDNLAHYRGHGR